MKAFTLVVAADGRAVLATRQELSALEQEAIVAAINSWRAFEPAGVLLVDDCEIIHVASIEIGIDLPTPVPA